jgi:hypothetical protein
MYGINHYKSNKYSKNITVMLYISSIRKKLEHAPYRSLKVTTQQNRVRYKIKP